MTPAKQLMRAVRKYYIDRIAAVVIDNHEAYLDRVHKHIWYRLKIYETAMNTAARATRDGNEEAFIAAQASALEARADLYDAMREYLFIDLSNDSEAGLPTRPAQYSVRDVTTNNGQTTTVLVKDTSSEIPNLNYPTPFYMGWRKDRIQQHVTEFMERFKNALQPTQEDP